MKNLALLIILGCTSLVGLAQTKAVTDTGDEVILYPDGTWKYLDPKVLAAKEIPENPNPFHKSDQATFMLKSINVKLGFWIDPKKWTFTKATTNNDAEYELAYKEGDLFAMIITEKLEIPLATLRSIAVENGRSAAPDLTIAKEEYRQVNGLKVLFMQLDGTMDGIKFSYYGYYYSDASGTVQFVTYTSQKLLTEYKEICDELLNGLAAAG